MTEIEVLCNGRWLRLCRRGPWEYVERTNPSGAAVIIAATPDGKALFVEQFRVPIQCRTIEFPAGLIGDLAGCEDEGILDSARRELYEETGYWAAHVEPIMGGPSSAGMSTEVMHFVRAWGLTRRGPGGGDASEQIRVHEVPLAEAAAFVAAHLARGYAVDPKVYAGVYFLSHDHHGRALPGEWFRTGPGA